MNIYEQKNNVYFNELKSLVETSKKWALQVNAKGKKRLLARGHIPKYAHLRPWIDEMTPLLSDPFYTVMTKTYWILHGIEDWDDPLVKCKNCGKPFKDKNVRNVYAGYFEFCSQKCASSYEDTKRKVKETNDERYGGHPMTLQATQDKGRKTKLEKYGDENYNNTEKAIETRYERFDGNYAPADFAQKCQAAHIANGHPANWNNREKAVKTRRDANDGEYDSPETQEKRRQTCLDRYGVEYVFQSEKFKEDSIQTCLDKYGVKYYIQSEQFKEESKQTCLDKYGVEHPSQCPEIYEKQRQTTLDLYGKEYYSQTEEYNVRTKQTNLEKYGKEYYVQTEECQERMRQTCLSVYGVEYYSQTEEKKIKSRATCLEKYGVENISQTERFWEEFRHTCLDRYGVEYPMQSPEIRNKSKRRYMFEGQQFDSSTEIEFFVYMRDCGYKILKDPGISFEYQFNGKIHAYFSDFLVVSKFGRIGLIEIKGDQFFREDGTMYCPYRNKNWTDEQYAEICAQYEAKRQCMLENDVTIIRYKSEYMKFIRSYVEEKYGKDYCQQFRNS